MPETVFEELKRYVRFDATDERALRALHGPAAPQFERIAEVFYERILSHAEARQVLVEGESQVGKLKGTLVAWMDSLLQGPWDEAYWIHRYRIGRVHVRIGMPQQYMFGAMNVIRTELMRVSFENFHADPTQLEQVRNALGRSSISSSPSCCTPTATTCSHSRRGSSGSPPSGSWSAPSATTCATRSA